LTEETASQFQDRSLGHAYDYLETRKRNNTSHQTEYGSYNAGHTKKDVASYTDVRNQCERACTSLANRMEKRLIKRVNVGEKSRHDKQKPPPRSQREIMVLEAMVVTQRQGV